MKRIGLALVLMFAFSLLPQAKPGSVMAGIGHVLTPMAHAQYGGPATCDDVFWQLDEEQFQGFLYYNIIGSQMIGWNYTYNSPIYEYTISVFITSQYPQWQNSTIDCTQTD